jgi:predicted nucleotidyltransferase component of viral defense system
VKPYATPAAFRSALESKLKNAARERNLTPMRLRKVVTFDRFLARLTTVAPDRWLLKGGAALDFRLQDRARTTVDLDLAFLAEKARVDADIIAATRINLGDYFTFTAERIPVPAGQEDVAASFRVLASIAGRLFEPIQLDVAWTDPFMGSELVQGGDLLSFADIQPVTVPAIPVEQHVGEKLHAYTRVYVSGPSSRVKDLVDLVLIALHRELGAEQLKRALDTTFHGRDTHVLPVSLPDPPGTWRGPYQRLAREVGLDEDMDKGWTVAAALLDPVLAGHVPGVARWHSATRAWKV